MATAASKGIKEFVFEWEGKDRNGKIIRGETRAGGINQVQAMLRRQGFNPCRTQMGPGRIERNVIVNQQGHGVSFRQ